MKVRRFGSILLIFVSAGALAADPVPTACDLLAAHPSDPVKITPGVATSVVSQDLPTAIAACRKDVESQPDVPRLNYYLGRVLFYDGQFAEGFERVHAAAAAGHAQAQFVAGLIVLDGEGEAIAADPCRTQSSWDAARKQGHFAATVSILTHHRLGAFSDCSGGPSEADMIASVKSLAEHPYAANYYNRLFLSLLEGTWRAAPDSATSMENGAAAHVDALSGHVTGLFAT